MPPADDRIPANPASAAPAAPCAAAGPPRWPSRQLLGEGNEALIEHGSTCYRLRLTSLGKLILTK